mgnify:CR=1 FL=1
MNEYKIHARGWIERHAQDISDWHQIIWRLAEPAWREYRSAAWYVDRLRKEGFTVEEGSAGMPTAFCAVWENGKGGPTVGAYAEYDATPANSQEQVPYECPREAQPLRRRAHRPPFRARHGSLAGVLAAKDAMRRYGIPGRIKFFGEPAEKMCGSKPLHAANGYYDDVDASSASTRAAACRCATPSIGTSTAGAAMAACSPSSAPTPKRGARRTAVCSCRSSRWWPEPPARSMPCASCIRPAATPIPPCCSLGRMVYQ